MFRTVNCENQQMEDFPMLQQNISQKQQQLLSVNQRQSLQILAYTNQELDTFLTGEYMQNPLLECVRERQSDHVESLDSHYESASSYRDHYLRWEDEDSDRRRDIRAREPLQMRSQLKGQLNIREYTDQEWKLIDYLIECLDDKGFFNYDTEEIAAASGCPVEMVDHCLSDLKKLEPAGIFSKDLSECLLAQLKAAHEQDPVLYRMISDHLPDLLHGSLSTVARSMGISLAECRRCIRRIGQLNPRPIMNTESAMTEYIIPDILVTYENNSWKIVLNDSWLGEYRYNDYYLHMMQTASDPELKKYFRTKFERARFIITSVERRRNTIIRIVAEIMEYQRDYFLCGGELLPMTMDTLASRLKISTSTVSRAVKNKYIQYRRPVLLRSLFTGSASEKTDTSTDYVHKKIRALVKNEDSTKPLSDDRISGILKKEGISISRRTVAKYRQQLGIPDSRLRACL